MTDARGDLRIAEAIYAEVKRRRFDDSNDSRAAAAAENEDRIAAMKLRDLEVLKAAALRAMSRGRMQNELVFPGTYEESYARSAGDKSKPIPTVPDPDEGQGGERVPSSIKAETRDTIIKMIKNKSTDKPGMVVDECDEYRSAIANNWYADPRNDPINHPIGYVALRTRIVRMDRDTNSHPVSDAFSNATGRMRISLELVPKAHEDAYLRPPAQNEKPCSQGRHCAGHRLPHNADWPAHVEGFTLVRFSTPQELAGRRPHSSHGLCVMCLREKTTNEWLDAAEADSGDNGVPSAFISQPYYVAVGVPGEYGEDAVISRFVAGKVTKLSDPFVFFKCTSYHWADDRLRQRNVDFDNAPRILPIPFRRYSLRSGAERSSIIGSAPPQTVPDPKDTAFIKRLERATKGSFGFEALDYMQRWVRSPEFLLYPPNSRTALVDRLERLLAAVSLATRRPGAIDIAPHAIAFGVHSLFDMTMRIVTRVPFFREGEPVMKVSEDDETDESMRRASGPDLPAPPVDNPLAEVEELIMRAMPYEKTKWTFPSVLAKHYAASRIVRLFVSSVVRCTLGGFYSWARDFPSLEKRFELMERFGVFAGRNTGMGATPRLVAMCIREYVCHVLESHDHVRTVTLPKCQPSWERFAASVRAGADALRKRFNDPECVLFDLEAVAVSECEADETKSKTALRLARPWMWTRAYKYFFTLYRVRLATEPDLPVINLRDVRMFDPRHAYDGTEAVLERAVSDAGYSPKACDLIRNFARSGTCEKRSPFVSEAYTICMIMHECFKIRVVRMPHHWCFPITQRPKIFFACTKCENVKTLGTKFRGMYDYHLNRFYCNKKLTKSNRDDSDEDFDDDDSDDSDDSDDEPEGGKPVGGKPVKRKKPARRRKAPAGPAGGGLPRRVPVSLCDYGVTCHETECIPLELYGNVVEFFGKVITVCATCKVNACRLDPFRTEACCRACAPQYRVNCALCDAEYKSTCKKAWTRLFVYNAPGNENHVWICFSHPIPNSLRGRNVIKSYETTMAELGAKKIFSTT